MRVLLFLDAASRGPNRALANLCKAFARRRLDHRHSCVAKLLQTANNGVTTMNNGCADLHIVFYTFLKHGSRDSVDESSPLLKSQIANGAAVQGVAEFNSVLSQRFERRLI